MSCDLPFAIPALQRLNVTLEGITSPVGLVRGDWLSSTLGIEVMSILLEEVMGYNTVINEAISSVQGAYMVAGCLDPSHPQVAERKCGPLFSAHHVFFEAWSTYAGDFEILARDVQTAPLDVGSVGYSGDDGSYIGQDILSSAWERDGLILEYYKSYNKKWYDPSIYFSAYTSLNTSMLMTCSMTKLWNSVQVEEYARLTNDNDGVEVVDDSLRAKCEGGPAGSWWFSPSCRSDPSTCIPYLDGGDGWNAQAIMTQAAVHNMPIAYAVAASGVDYRHLPTAHPILYYWWTPDDIFLKQSPVRIIFPPHDFAAWAKNDKRSAAESVRLIKFVHYKMDSMAGRVKLFVEQLRFSLKDLEAMMLDSQLTQDSERLVACRWVQQNQDSWRSAIPDARSCFAGWGMVSANGDYVENRSLARECAWCKPGYFSTPSVDVIGRTHICIPCSLGSFQETSGQTMCEMCIAGRYGDSLALPYCRQCWPGTYSTSNASVCEQCAPGKSAAKAGSSSCTPCALGTCAASAGSMTCRSCELGHYADIDGMTACIKCGAKHTGCASCGKNHGQKEEDVGQGEEDSAWTTMHKVAGRDEWVYMIGATSNESCGCDKGLRLEGEECVACAEGMSCNGMGEVLIEAGYYSELPLSVYHCFGNKKRCPGGPPQETCATNRKGISCAECVEAKKPDADGTCVDCTGSDTAPLIVTCALVLILLCFMYYALAFSGITGTSHEMLLATISCGQLFTVVQQLGVVALMDIEFEDPMKSLLRATRFFMFDIEVFNFGCIGSVGPLSRFTATAFSFFALLILTAAIHSVSVKLFHKGNFKERMPQLVSSVGTVCLVVFISAVSAMLGPLQCSEHPNGKWTSRTYSAVICWDSDESPDHMAMVILGLCCLSGPIGFLSCVTWISWQLPQKIFVGEVQFLRTYGFLFFRFRPGVGWYINLILLRSFLVALTPVVPESLLQILISYVVHLLSLMGVIYFKPWRVRMANVLDVTFSFLMLTVIIMAALFVKEDDFRLFSWVVTSCIIVTTLAVPWACVRSLYVIFARKLKPYQFFLCHHKAKAGAFARMLKAVLVENPKVSRGVFLDSDDLSQLDELFNTVANEIDCLVIIGTPGVFLRPWCAGEMTIARLKNIQTIILAMPDWKPPDDAIIDRFDQIVDMQCLSENNISLELVQSTMRWIGTLPTIQMPKRINFLTLDSVVNCLTSSGNGPGGWPHGGSVIADMTSMKTEVKKQVKLGILVDETDMEGFAAAHFLKYLMLPHTIHSPLSAPAVFQSGDIIPQGLEKIIIICTKGCFDKPDFLQTLFEACGNGAQVLPVVADPKFEFPTLEWLIKLQCQESLVFGASGEDLASMIGNIFHEIAAIFQPQHAADAILQVNAKQIAKRILSGSMKAVSNSCRVNASTIPTSFAV